MTKCFLVEGERMVIIKFVKKKQLIYHWTVKIVEILKEMERVMLYPFSVGAFKTQFILWCGKGFLQGI
jgi:hypothetical protein